MVIACCATSAGCRKVMLATSTPTLIRLVTAASAARRVHPSK